LKNKTNLLVIFFALLLDQLSKLWVLKVLKFSGPVLVVPGILEFRYAENTGIAFSLFNQHPIILTALVTIIIVGMMFAARKSHKLNLGLACIVAGGLGNLFDRVRLGFVVDFINPLFIDFAIFNVADILLNIGVALLIIDSFSKKDLL